MRDDSDGAYYDSDAKLTFTEFLLWTDTTS